MIQINQLTKIFGNNLVLKNIDLNFSEGQVHGIVGDNGAGKSTFFRCIAGFETYSGTIHSSYHKIKEVLAYLPTDPYFFPKITGREYLQLLCHARNIKYEDFEYFNIFDLPLHYYAETYSTGMKKKLALTALLLQKNNIFILDEPFNGVDLHSNMIISELILKLKNKNKIVIISSHIFSTLTHTCDYLHLLKATQISKSVDKSQFDSIENEMRGSLISDKLDRFEF